MERNNGIVMDIGIDKNNRKIITDDLSRVLADTFILSLKARNYHWNVTGPHFSQLHSLFGNIYEELDTSGDAIAERIRALGHKAPASYVEFLSISVIKEEIGAPKYMDMIRHLVLDIEHLIRRIDEVKEVAATAKDDATADLMIGQVTALGKMAWMLRSQLEQ